LGTDDNKFVEVKTTSPLPMLPTPSSTLNECTSSYKIIILGNNNYINSKEILRKIFYFMYNIYIMLLFAKKAKILNDKNIKNII